MKKNLWLIILAVISFGCGSSSDNFKFYNEIKIQKNGSIALVGKELDSNNLPREYHKVYLKKDGKIDKDYFMSSDHSKRDSMYIYNENGKIAEIRYFEEGKYNGVSKFTYDKGGNIEKELMYDNNQEFLFSKTVNE